MTTDMIPAAPSGLLVERPRVQALLSSFLVTMGAVLAALAAAALLLVAFPLMMAATATMQSSAKRRGWTEIEPLEG